jgi:glycosyltransferase involved in cell wall biosynthesis
MARFLREWQADVSYDRTFLMTLIAADAAQRAGVPNVSTIVTDPTLGFAPVAGRFQMIKKRRLRRLYQRSAQVLAVSDGAARSAERFYGLKTGSVETLYNGFDFERIQAESQTAVDDPWWNGSGSSSRVLKLVSAGRLNRDKGFHLLIEAVRRLKQQNPETEFRLAILGDGDEGRPQLEAQIRDSGLQNEVHLPGFRKDALAWYRSADAYVLPSLLEGMPNVLLEAMACGTPVIAADCPSGPAEILEDGRYGVLCGANSSDALQSGIQSLLDDGPAAAQTADAARDYVRERFSVSVTVRRLESILKAVAKPRP